MEPLNQPEPSAPQRVAPIAAPDGNSPYVASSPTNVTGDGTGGVIPYKNPQALAAYYIGLFSLMPCLGLVMAPSAIWLGVQGLKYAKTYPIVRGQTHAWVGIVCGGFWTLIYWGATIIGLIAYALGH